MINAKPQHELSVFKDFANAAGISIDTSTAEIRNSPEPDIRCICAGEPVYFELSRILDDYMQSVRNKALKNAPTQVPVDASRAGMPERDALQKKLSKLYQTDGVPLELLLYYDTEHPRVLGRVDGFSQL